MSSTITLPQICWTGGTVPNPAALPETAPAELRGHRWAALDSPALARQGESHSRFLHVAEQGAVLQRSGSRVLLTAKEKVLLEVPVIKLQGVLVYGSIQISTQCLRLLLDEGVWLSFFTRHGTYKGRLQPPADGGGKLRRLQWERSCDPQFCLNFGRGVVRGKILAARQVAAAYAKNYLAETLGEGHRVLRESLERLETVKDLDELRGVEGNAGRAYFDLFRRWNRSEFLFPGRVKRGAADPINVLLNFGYTLLARELEGLLEAAGLDPAVGFYHLPDGDRPSLACDWVEEFRHAAVDRLVLKLINNGVMKPDDFEDRGEKGGLRLATEGLRKFLRAYEKTLLGSGEPEDYGAAPGFRGIFLEQLARLLDSLTGGTPYRTWLER